MAILAVNMDIPHATSVKVEEDTLTVELDDGRTVSVPVAWYPRLLHASNQERMNWRLIGKGRGIHWETVDEDISVDFEISRTDRFLYRTRYFTDSGIIGSSGNMLDKHRSLHETRFVYPKDLCKFFPRCFSINRVLALPFGDC